MWVDVTAKERIISIILLSIYTVSTCTPVAAVLCSTFTFKQTSELRSALKCVCIHTNWMCIRTVQSPLTYRYMRSFIICTLCNVYGLYNAIFESACALSYQNGFMSSFWKFIHNYFDDFQLSFVHSFVSLSISFVSFFARSSLECTRCFLAYSTMSCTHHSPLPRKPLQGYFSFEHVFFFLLPEWKMDKKCSNTHIPYRYKEK